MDSPPRHGQAGYRVAEWLAGSIFCFCDNAFIDLSSPLKCFFPSINQSWGLMELQIELLLLTVQVLIRPPHPRLMAPL